MPNQFLTKVQKQLMEEDNCFYEWCSNNWLSIGKKMNLNITPYTKTNSQCIMELNVKLYLLGGRK